MAEKKRNKKDKDEEQVFPSPPPAYQMPEPIPDTPENVALAIMKGPPKKEWRYLKERKEK